MLHGIPEGNDFHGYRLEIPNSHSNVRDALGAGSTLAFRSLVKCLAYWCSLKAVSRYCHYS
jgi:hypothetical protein